VLRKFLGRAGGFPARWNIVVGRHSIHSESRPRTGAFFFRNIILTKRLDSCLGKCYGVLDDVKGLHDITGHGGGGDFAGNFASLDCCSQIYSTEADTRGCSCEEALDEIRFGPTAQNESENLLEGPRQAA
jgi:hypothetical protein